MRNKRETDISNYTGKIPELAPEKKKSESGAARFFKAIGKFLLTVFSILLIAGVITGVSLSIYIFTLANEPTGIDLKAKSMNQTSRILVKDQKSGEFVEKRKLYSTENRIWVSNQDIPAYMKEAQVAIEDKRFYEHNGVDWQRTLSAIATLTTGSDSYGGSTITQQLIKNITDDNEVSINRKLREICKALKLEKEYTKDQILEAYLNVVNFGNNCQGVEAAAQLYFGKSIKDCTLAECAAIAGITQNPSQYNPLIYPENNQNRRELILAEMHDQEIITDEEYEKAKKESANMKFVGFKAPNEDEDEDEDADNVQNWYEDQIVFDLRRDLAQYYNISEGAASEKIYTEGLKIYSAMDESMQNYIEQAALNMDKGPDPDLQIGSVMMGFDGRVIAAVGSSKRKTGDLELDRSTHSVLQPGSAIKPLFVYPIAINTKQLYYSSTVLDEPIDKYEADANGNYISGPRNAYGSYFGNMLLPDAIEYSSNATAVQVMELIGGPSVAYEQAVTKMGFEHLDQEDANMTGALSIGGMRGGVTVREMAAAYAYMGNGGLYYKPYTYYYVTDSEDNIIIDNREQVPKQAYTAETATIMNRLLHYNVENSQHTRAVYAKIPGWDIVGKTGTTNDDKDAWFCGLSPYCVMATWTGFDSPDTISDTTHSAKFFATVMGEYLKGRDQKKYQTSPNVIAATYNPISGLIISTEDIQGKYIGYYTEDNMPAFGSPYYGDVSYGDNSGGDYGDGYSSDYAGGDGGGGAESAAGGGGQASDAGGGADSSAAGGGDGQASDAGGGGGGQGSDAGGGGGGQGSDAGGGGQASGGGGAGGGEGPGGDGAQAQ